MFPNMQDDGCTRVCEDVHVRLCACVCSSVCLYVCISVCLCVHTNVSIRLFVCMAAHEGGGGGNVSVQVCVFVSCAMIN